MSIGAKEMGKENRFHFILEKHPQIHSHVICRILVWTACVSHNLTAIAPPAELGREQEYKYNAAIHSLTPKITLWWHVPHFSSKTKIWLSKVWADCTACDVWTHFSFQRWHHELKTNSNTPCCVAASPPTASIFSTLSYPSDFWEPVHICCEHAELH